MTNPEQIVTHTLNLSGVTFHVEAKAGADFDEIVEKAIEQEGMTPAFDCLPDETPLIPYEEDMAEYLRAFA